MTQVVHRWKRLQLCTSYNICIQANCYKLVALNCLNIVLKMTDKRAPPFGAFRLNPLSSPTTISSNREDITNSDTAKVENKERDTTETGDNSISPKVKQAPQNAAGEKSVDRVDQGVMMKMIVSGPPSQVKRQKILPETLLQKVTNIVRQQIMNQDASLAGELNSVSLSEDTSTESCVSNESSGEICDRQKTETLEQNEVNKSIEEIDNTVETLGKVNEICDPPSHEKLKPATDGAVVINEDTQITVDETGMNPFGNLLIDEYGDLSDTAEVNKEACTKCSNDIETDPFGGLFIENETDNPTDKKASKNKKIAADEVYNLAPLFSGDLEKWRKRELKKEKKKHWKKKKGKSVRKELDDTEDDKKEDKAGKTEHKPVPNYFVAIQITDPKIHAGIRRVQDDVVSGNEKLKPALNKLATLHLTMFVVHLQTDDEMTRAKRAMDQCQKKLEPLYHIKPLSLDIGGLGNFRNSVVFAKVRLEEQITQLKEIADIVEDCFLDQEIVSTEKSGSFKPHITVMKLTRDKSFRKKGGIKKINESLYKDHIDAAFGQQCVNTLQLCAMLKKKTESGYYQVEHAVQFGPNFMDSDDTESNENIASGKLVATDQDKEAIKMLLDEVIQNVIDSDENKTVCDVSDTKCLESNKTEELEALIVSDRIAQNANDEETFPDTKDTSMENNVLGSESDSVKHDSSVSIVDKAESIEESVEFDSNLSEQHKLNLGICLPRTREIGETNAILCDSQTNLEVILERKGGLKESNETSDCDVIGKLNESTDQLINRSVNSEETVNDITCTSSKPDVIVDDKTCDKTSTADDDVKAVKKLGSKEDNSS